VLLRHNRVRRKSLPQWLVLLFWGTLPRSFCHIKDGKPAKVKQQDTSKGTPKHKKPMSAQAAAEPIYMIAMGYLIRFFSIHFNLVLAAKAMQETEIRLPPSLTKQPTVLQSA
jgi:hypothetical protein